MAQRKTDPDQIARVLVYAELHTDEEAAEYFGLGVRTIQRYRKRLAESDDLAETVAYRVAEAKGVDNWAQDATQTVRSMLEFLRRASVEMTPTPETVMAAATALGVVLDAKIALQLIDARITEIRRTQDSADRPNASSSFGDWTGDGRARATA